MNRLLKYILFALLVFFASCEEELDLYNACIEDIDYEEFEINFDLISGFDDYNSEGAAFVAAIDTNKNAAIIIALRFDLPLREKTFYPSCNPIETAIGYKWEKTNSYTTEIVREYPYISDFVTNTEGIRNMFQDIAAFLIIDADNDLERQIFVAAEGELELTRLDDYTDILQGELSFIQITSAGTDALITDGALYYEIEDIQIKWKANNQAN